jgi:hypothetical protein
MLRKLHYWLIKLVVGKRPVIMNAKLDQHEIHVWGNNPIISHCTIVGARTAITVRSADVVPDFVDQQFKNYMARNTPTETKP